MGVEETYLTAHGGLSIETKKDKVKTESAIYLIKGYIWTEVKWKTVLETCLLSGVNVKSYPATKTYFPSV